MIRYVPNNGYQKDMCLKEIGLCVPNMLTILRSLVNMIKEIHMTTL